MSSEENQGLLLNELGAEVPSWLDSPTFFVLDQGPEEGIFAFGDRACNWLRDTPNARSVVVAVSAQSLQRIDSSVRTLGRQLVEAIRSRSQAKLLLCVPADATEKQRKQLLALTFELTQEVPSQTGVVVGAHFSARPPPSGTLPIAGLRSNEVLGSS